MASEKLNAIISKRYESITEFQLEQSLVRSFCFVIVTLTLAHIRSELESLRGQLRKPPRMAREREVFAESQLPSENILYLSYCRDDTEHSSDIRRASRGASPEIRRRDQKRVPERNKNLSG